MGLIGGLDDLSERNRHLAELAKRLDEAKAKKMAERKAKAEARKLKPEPKPEFDDPALT